MTKSRRNVNWMTPERRKVYEQLTAAGTPHDLAIEASGIMVGETRGDVVFEDDDGEHPDPLRQRALGRPWVFEVAYGDRAIRWQDGSWMGDPLMVKIVQQRIATGEAVPNAVPSSFPPDHWLSVQPLLTQLFGDWDRVIEDRMPDPPWFNDPPGTVY